ncbi:MAG TPA: ABC transporter ATP-binding protein [Gemmataceae bacterium]|nr:ABC transporter ATP-binding protein [Gemmataceae bacterium]
MIDVRELRFAYPDGRQALDGVTIHVTAGESVGLIGPNGAGKTTLFLCLCGVLRAAPGSIRIAALDPAALNERKQLPSHVGVVFQNPDDQLFSSTIGEDVAFGPLNLHLSAEEVKKRVAEALDRVGMTGQDDRVPFHLSGGEKRRAAIAGVLAMHPEVLLLDEPSMFLDPRGRRELIRLINDLPGTKLIASHDLALVRDTCSRVILMDAGRVVTEGKTEILKDSALMEEHGLEAV